MNKDNAILTKNVLNYAKLSTSYNQLLNNNLIVSFTTIFFYRLKIVCFKLKNRTQPANLPTAGFRPFFQALKFETN